MIWTISYDCFVTSHNGHTFELGEMGRGHWILKHWHGKPQSDWYHTGTVEEGKALADKLYAQAIG